MKCLLCEEGNTTEVEETFMFSPIGYEPKESKIWGLLCDTCGVHHSNNETSWKTYEYCQNLKKTMILMK